MQVIPGFFGHGFFCCTARARSRLPPRLQEVSSIGKTRNQLFVNDGGGTDVQDAGGVADPAGIHDHVDALLLHLR